MWVLIATIMHVGYGVATASVDGFSSRDACLEAAKEFSINTRDNLHVSLSAVKTSTSCVSK